MTTRLCRFLSIVLLLTSLSSAQTAEEIDLSVDVWKEVIPRVLKDKFKPAQSPMTVELYEEGLRWEWLPAIENVSFVLLSRKEIESREIQVHFFKSKAVRNSKGEIFVDFGFGNPFCSASGSRWYFPESDGPTVLEPSGTGWGMGCGSGHGTGH